MKQRKFLGIILSLVFLPVLASCGPPDPPDSGDLTMAQAGQFIQDTYLGIAGVSLRPVSNEFADYLIFFAFQKLRVHLFAYESPNIVNMCLSQFELPADSDSYMDTAGVIRPNADMRAPILHFDILSSSFSMDFYNYNQDHVDVDTFFGGQLDDILAALEIADPYQRLPQSEGGNRGEYTPHLEPYKSAYRIEIEKPDTDPPDENYWDVVYQVLTAYYDAYLTSLEALKPEEDQDLIQGNIEGFDEMFNILWEEDVAVKMGRLMFGDDIDLYFKDAFWREGVYYSEV